MTGSAQSQSNVEKKCALYEQPADEKEWKDTLNRREKWRNKEQLENCRLKSDRN